MTLNLQNTVQYYNEKKISQIMLHNYNIICSSQPQPINTRVQQCHTSAWCMLGNTQKKSRIYSSHFHTHTHSHKHRERDLSGSPVTPVRGMRSWRWDSSLRSREVRRWLTAAWQLAVSTEATASVSLLASPMLTNGFWCYSELVC